jgi:hypothetical protein
VLNQQGLPVISAMGLRYKFTGAVTYTSASGTPATGTISVAAGQALIGSTAVSYNAMSVGVTGTNGTSTTFYLYLDDPNFDGGAATLFATTSTTAPYGFDGRMFVGSCTVVFPSSGGGGGGGDGGISYCVHADANVITRDRGIVLGRDIVPGDWTKVVTLDGSETEWSMVTHNHVETDAVYLIRSKSGIELTVSHTTPLTLRDGKSIFPHMLKGQCLPVEDDDGFRWEECWAYRLLSAEVAHISCGSRVYAAGNKPDKFIYTHNIAQKP